MSIDKWTLESALDAAVDCLNRHLPGYIQARLDADAERDRPLINGKLPVPKVVTTGMLDDLAADWVTPSIFLNATSTSYQNHNASSLLDSQPRVTATILMAEGDIDTSEQRIYSNALSMYSDGVRYILSTIFPEDGGCEVGVQAATPDSVQYSPLVRPDGYPVWLRWSEVSVVWTQRVVNSWDTDPPPFDPLTLGPLIWLDASDVATMFVDSAGTVPVVAPGDPVGRWKNKGTDGASGDAVQTVSAYRPIRGDGLIDITGSQRLDFGGGSWVLPDDATIVMWLNGRSPTNSARYFNRDNPPTKRIVSRGLGALQGQAQGVTGGAIAAGGAGPGYAELYSKEGIHMRLQHKDAVTTSVAVQSGYTPMADYKLGSSSADSGEGFECMEVIIIPGQLTADQRAGLRQYLEEKHT